MNWLKLKAKITECGYASLSQLEKDTGIKPSTMSRKINGKTEFKLCEINALRSALRLSSDETMEIFF